MRILVFGDSITQGHNDEKNGGWCNKLVNFVFTRRAASSSEYDKSIINLGVSGDSTMDILTRIEAETDARVTKYPSTDDVCLLAVGVNDSQFEMDTRKSLISPSGTLKNLESILKILTQYVKQVVVIGIAPITEERLQPMAWNQTRGYSTEEVTKYNKILEKFSEENKLLFINLDTVYGDSASEYLPDGIHPNSEGHQLIYERVRDTLEKEGINGLSRRAIIYNS